MSRPSMGKFAIHRHLNARMLESADREVSKTFGESRVGSSPTLGTKLIRHLQQIIDSINVLSVQFRYCHMAVCLMVRQLTLINYA